MSEVLIRAQTKSILSGVTGISNVHDYQRWAKDWAKFLNLFKEVTKFLQYMTPLQYYHKISRPYFSHMYWTRTII